MIDAAPVVDAFTGGVVTALSAAFVAMVLLGGIALIRRILGA